MTRNAREAYHPETYWNEVAESVMERTSESYLAGDDAPYDRYQRNRFIDRFLNTIDFESKVILEVGCGPGGNLQEILRKNPKKLFGVDISNSMLELASQNLHDYRKLIELQKIDGVKLPFSNKFMDITLTVTVLMHNFDEKMFAGLVREMCRVTKDMLVIIEHTSLWERRGRTAITRTVKAYEEECNKNDFELSSCYHLNTCCSLFFHHAIRKVWSKFFGYGHKEGEPFPPILRLVMITSLLFTRVFDHFLPLKIGLTKMVFLPKDIQSAVS